MSMSAKELLAMLQSGDSYLVTSYKGEAGATKEVDDLIIRALSLLSSVEDGEGIVRELGGFTPGPWEWNGKDQLWGGERGEAGALEQILNSADDGKSYGMHSACIEHHWDEKVAEANRRLIAAAPTLLARITLDAQEKAALQATLDEVSAAIGDVRYMDPPDGGDVPIAEQVRRMRAELASVKAERDSLGTQLEQIAHERTP